MLDLIDSVPGSGVSMTVFGIREINGHQKQVWIPEAQLKTLLLSLESFHAFVFCTLINKNLDDVFECISVDPLLTPQGGFADYSTFKNNHSFYIRRALASFMGKKP